MFNKLNIGLLGNNLSCEHDCIKKNSLIPSLGGRSVLFLLCNSQKQKHSTNKYINGVSLTFSRVGIKNLTTLIKMLFDSCIYSFSSI